MFRRKDHKGLRQAGGVIAFTTGYAAVLLLLCLGALEPHLDYGGSPPAPAIAMQEPEAPLADEVARLSESEPVLAGLSGSLIARDM